MAIRDGEAVEKEMNFSGLEDFGDDGDSETDEYDSDDSDEDPSYDVFHNTRSGLSQLSGKKCKSRISKEVVEETRSSLSKLSLKKPKSRTGTVVGSVCDEESESFEVKVPELNEKDAKYFETVEEIIRARQLEKLKVDQCKIYLRKFGLRLTGKKDVLMKRIREHLEVIDGGGEKKYPASTFILNCKGDACTGDVVMFEQNVYEMYSIASRSATGPPCGTRIVAGRIVKESYGAAKQQHTFTIEVLWSKGEKPLPPLHPLLIKGRNLYRLKTLRQTWADEEERRKVLLEKHLRGTHARCSRETRLQEKELRKMLGVSRIKRKDSISTREQRNEKQQQNPIPCKDVQQPNPAPRQLLQQQPNIHQQQQNQIHRDENRQPNIHQQQQKPHQNSWSGSHEQQNPLQKNENQKSNIQQPQNPNIKRCSHAQILEKQLVGRNSVNALQNSNLMLQQPWQQNGILPSPDGGILSSPDRQHFQPKRRLFHVQAHPNAAPTFRYREPLKSSNSAPWLMRSSNSSLQSQGPHWKSTVQRQACPFYPKGKCWYGDACKYLHE